MADKNKKQDDRRPAISNQADDLMARLTRPGNLPPSAGSEPASEPPPAAAEPAEEPDSEPEKDREKEAPSKQQAADQTNKSGRQKWKEKRKKRRYQLEIDEDIKERIGQLSDELGVSQSQLVQFFIITGLQNPDAITPYLEPSPAPMWKHRIDFDKLRRDLKI